MSNPSIELTEENTFAIKGIPAEKDFSDMTPQEAFIYSLSYALRVPEFIPLVRYFGVNKLSEEIAKAMFEAEEGETKH